MHGRSRTAETLGLRALNRALLARQLLLERRQIAVDEAIEHLVGLQAQNPGDPYIALWTRLAGFRPALLGEMVAGRRAVRLALLRATVHLVTARDCLAIRPVVQPVLDRGLRATSYGRDTAPLDRVALIAAGRALVDEQPLSIAELGARLHERWPEVDPRSLAYAVHYSLPLVQIPPRGVWGKSGRPVCTTAQHWLGQPLAAETAPDALILRYLAAFGPATVADIRTWSGLSGLREVVERLRPRLRAFRDEEGRELLDVPGAPLPDPDTPAPPRFLPQYDNILLSHVDRRRIVSDDHRRYWASANGVGPGTVLVDGFARCTWRVRRGRGRATLLVGPVEPLSGEEWAAVAEEGARLLALLAADAPERDVQFTPTT